MSVKKSVLLLLATLVTHAGLVAEALGDTSSDGLFDPTRPAYAPTKSTSPIVRGVDPVSRVTAVFQNGDRRVAVLDGRVVKAGDHIGDVVIQEVLADGVRYTRAGRVEVVRLPRQAAQVRSAGRDGDRKASIRQEIRP